MFGLARQRARGGLALSCPSSRVERGFSSVRRVCSFWCAWSKCSPLCGAGRWQTKSHVESEAALDRRHPNKLRAKPGNVKAQRNIPGVCPAASRLCFCRFCLSAALPVGEALVYQRNLPIHCRGWPLISKGNLVFPALAKPAHFGRSVALSPGAGGECGALPIPRPDEGPGEARRVSVFCCPAWAGQQNNEVRRGARMRRTRWFLAVLLAWRLLCRCAIVTTLARFAHAKIACTLFAKSVRLVCVSSVLVGLRFSEPFIAGSACA